MEKHYAIYSDYREIGRWRFVGQIEKIPAAISQGKTIEELKSILLDALKLLLEVNRENTEIEHEVKDVIRGNTFILCNEE